MERRGPFDGFVEKVVRTITTCLIMTDDNRYSVDATAADQMVLVRSHAEGILVALVSEFMDTEALANAGAAPDVTCASVAS